jgi:hypothetical protein
MPDSETFLRLTLLTVGLVLLGLLGLMALSLLSWRRRFGNGRSLRPGRGRPRGGRRIMPDLWQAGGDRLAQRFTQAEYEQRGGSSPSEPPPAGEGSGGPEGPDLREAELDGESWKYGKPYEPRFDPQGDAHDENDPDDDEYDDEDDGDGDVPIPPPPRM